MSISSIAGLDALQAASAPKVYVGEDVLSASVAKDLAPSPPPAVPASPAAGSTSAAPATGKNPYQTAYEQSVTASSVALMRSLGAGASPSTPQYDDGSPASALSGISTMMDALKAGIAEGMFTGTGFDHNG